MIKHELVGVECPVCGEFHFMVALPCESEQYKNQDGTIATHWSLCPLTGDQIWLSLANADIEIDPSYIIVQDCSACGGVHMVKVHPYQYPVDLDGLAYTHFALCPLTDQVLLVAADDDQKAA